MGPASPVGSEDESILPRLRVEWRSYVVSDHNTI